MLVVYSVLLPDQLLATDHCCFPIDINAKSESGNSTLFVKLQFGLIKTVYFDFCLSQPGGSVFVKSYNFVFEEISPLYVAERNRILSPYTRDPSIIRDPSITDMCMCCQPATRNLNRSVIVCQLTYAFSLSKIFFSWCNKSSKGVCSQNHWQFICMT